MTAKLYINTDVAITLTPGTGFVMADVVSASITLSRSGGAETLTLTSAGGAITLGASTMTVKIPDTGGITAAGVYNIRITFVDASGNIRGLTPDAETLTFYS
jgi:hypothetical protein